MFNMSENSSLLGPAWYILQVLRVCNIIALLSVGMSSMIMVVKTNMITNFWIFQAVAHVITCGVSVVLIVSELPQPAAIKNFYRNNWPTFSTLDASNRGHSLAWLGAWMLALGVWVMGSLNAANQIATLSFPLWRFTLASGILAIVFGVFNLIVSAIFRNGNHNITVRMIREHGANVYNVRMVAPDYGFDAATLNSSERSNSIRREKQQQPFHSQFNFNRPFPAMNVNRLSNNRFSKLWAKKNGNKPQISAPIVHDPIVEPDVEAAYPSEEDRQSWEGHDRASPIVPNLQRPPTALHPAYTGARSSVYSEASHLNRF